MARLHPMIKSVRFTPEAHIARVKAVLDQLNAIDPNNSAREQPRFAPEKASRA